MPQEGCRNIINGHLRSAYLAPFGFSVLHTATDTITNDAKLQLCEYAAYCCVWFHPMTDYAYIEPACTVPDHRGKGLAKAVIYKALNRARSLGAKKAYVIRYVLL